MALTHLDRPSTRVAPDGPDDQVVLCVEDDVIQQAHLAEVLTRHGYRVEVASCGAEVELALRDTSPHTVLLDLGLPDIDGVELCRRLAVWPGSPIVVVSADSDEDRIVAALDAGACDYVIKPFDVGVLLARLRVARREREVGRRVPDDDVITVGDLTLDIGAHQVWTGADAVDLYPRPFAVLELLMRNEGALLSYATLAGRRRGDAVPDAELKALRIAVSRIRKAIGTGPDRPVVLTEPRIGYRLVRADA